MVETQECFQFKMFNPFTYLGAPLIKKSLGEANKRYLRMSLQKPNPSFQKLGQIRLQKLRDKRANYGLCKANFVLAQKETKNVSHMSPKSGQSVLKTKETKGTQVHLFHAFYFMLYAFALLSPPQNLCSPITMRHLALLSYS